MDDERAYSDGDSERARENEREKEIEIAKSGWVAMQGEEVGTDLGVYARILKPLHPSIRAIAGAPSPRGCTHRYRIEGCSGADLGRVLGRRIRRWS